MDATGLDRSILYALLPSDNVDCYWRALQFTARLLPATRNSKMPIVDCSLTDGFPNCCVIFFVDFMCFMTWNGIVIFRMSCSNMMNSTSFDGYDIWCSLRRSWGFAASGLRTFGVFAAKTRMRPQPGFSFLSANGGHMQNASALTTSQRASACFA